MSRLSAETQAAAARQEAAQKHFLALCDDLARHPRADRKEHRAAVRAIRDAAWDWQGCGNIYHVHWDRDNILLRTVDGIRIGELTALLEDGREFLMRHKGKDTARLRDSVDLALRFVDRDVSGAILVFRGLLGRRARTRPE